MMVRDLWPGQNEFPIFLLSRIPRIKRKNRLKDHSKLLLYNKIEIDKDTKNEAHNG